LQNYKQNLQDYKSSHTISRESSISVDNLRLQLLFTCGTIIHLCRSLNVQVDPENIYWYALLLLHEVDVRGAASACSYGKYLKRYSTVYALRSNDLISKIPRPMSFTHAGHPKALSRLLTLRDQGDNGIRILLTIMGLVSLIKSEADPSHEAITGKYTGKFHDQEALEFSTFCEKIPFLKRDGQDSIPEASVLNIDEYSGYSTFSGGPNGPSLLGCVHDFDFLKRKDKGTLDYIQRMYSITSNPVFVSLRSLGKLRDSTDPSQLSRSRGCKVIQLCEGGGKTRNIAVVDYWTQEALKPIHDKVFGILKSIPEDGTFDQDRAFSLIKDKCELDNCAYSFDLSSATDRFPLKLQRMVVTNLFGLEIADLWSKILAERTFSFRGKNIRWELGQPLGSLSSWGVFTLTHHSFIRWCAEDPNFDGYVMLGDDVVIFDRQVAMRYADKMNGFGVSINLGKTFIANEGVVYGEFCKRIFRHRVELSAIPAKLVIACKNDIKGHIAILYWAASRWGLCVTSSVVADYISGLDLSEKEKSMLHLRFLEVKISGVAFADADCILPVPEWMLQASIGREAVSYAFRAVQQTASYIQGIKFPGKHFHPEGLNGPEFLAYDLLRKFNEKEPKFKLGPVYIEWLTHHDSSPLLRYTRRFISGYESSWAELNRVTTSNLSDYARNSYEFSLLNIKDVVVPDLFRKIVPQPIYSRVFSMALRAFAGPDWVYMNKPVIISASEEESTVYVLPPYPIA